MTDTAEYAAMLDLRERILRKPLGLALTDAEKQMDLEDYLLGAFDGDQILGCLILQKKDDGSVKMRQVAVSETAQGRGIGRKMLQAAYDVLRDWRVSRLYCHARGTAVDFYRQNGWTITGDTFLEQNIPHFRMDIAVPAEKDSAVPAERNNAATAEKRA